MSGTVIPAIESGTEEHQKPICRQWWRLARMALIVFSGIAIGLVLDQTTKALAVDSITASGPMEIAGRLRLTLVANKGVIGGTPVPAWVVAAATLTMFVVGLRWLFNSRTAALVAFAGVAGGAFGNLLDRLLHRPAFPDHAVVDWISIRGFATFNVADMLIVAGGVGLYLALRRDQPVARPTGF